MKWVHLFRRMITIAHPALLDVPKSMISFMLQFSFSTLCCMLRYSTVNKTGRWICPVWVGTCRHILGSCKIRIDWKDKAHNTGKINTPFHWENFVLVENRQEFHYLRKTIIHSTIVPCLRSAVLYWLMVIVNDNTQIINNSEIVNSHLLDKRFKIGYLILEYR